MFACPSSVIGFIQSLISLTSYYGDSKLKEYIRQDLPSNWIIGFLEVYK